MQTTEFERLKTNYQSADVEGKIDIYATTEGLTPPQYKELLKLFPQNEISKLEAALQ